MPTSGNTNYDKLLEYFEKQKLTLEELDAQYGRLLEKIWSQETSLERLNRLQDEAKKSEEELNKIREEGEKLLNKRGNRGRIREMEKLVQLEQELSELHEGQFSSVAQYQKAVDDLNKKIDKQKDSIERNFAGGLDHAKEVFEEYSRIQEEVNVKNIEHFKNLNAQQEEFNKRQEEGITFLDDWGETVERNTKTFRKGVSDIGDGVKKMGNALWSTIEPWRKANHEAMAYAKTMGMSQKTADKYLASTVSWAAKNDIGILFNKSTDELIKMQGKYSEVLGRNVQLTGEQKKDMLAMETFLGEDGMMDIANNLENFGLGMSDSADFIKETMDEATKSGIAASKLTKTIRENIKMAQNYTFRDGLKGLESMARKAIELKTDMSLVSSFIDKVSTVEGAITTGAQLQVLGGNYALGSDPLSMLYESLNDVEGLFDRAVGMARGKVMYNNATGNFEMGAMDRYMMKQAATAMGVDPSKMMDVAFRQASLSRIEGQARMNANIAGDADMMNLVKNLATWDNGKAVVDIDGKAVNVSDLTAQDKEKLEAMQRTDSQNLQDMAVSLRSMNDIMSGTEKEINNEQAKATHSISSKLNDLLKNTEALNKVAQVIAYGKMVMGGFEMILGGFTVVQGLLRTLVGTYNMSTGGSPMLRGRMRRGGGTARRLAQIAKQHGGKGIGRALGKVGGKIALGSAGAGLLAGTLSLGTDIATGEFKKDTGGSVGRALGQTAGAAIGMALGGPIGAMIGGALAGAVTSGIQKWQKNNRDKIRNDIASELSGINPTLSGLFSGPNALQGNYKKRQLNRLKDALSDGILEEGELNSGLLRKARANDDLIRMRDSGIDVRIPMATGGYLEGRSHQQGGMPILGTNISVEGGEYVINKEATQRNLPLLDSINSGEYSMVSKEPLGKQMKVHRGRVSDGMNMSHNSTMNVAPIDIKFSGTIKLDLGTRQVDVSDELLKNPQFIQKMTDFISKQINIYDNGAYNKGNFKQKFI